LSICVLRKNAAMLYILAKEVHAVPSVIRYMYFGSVKFFRHLILSVVFGWIGIATLLAVFFGIKCHKLETEDPPPQTIEEYISRMTADGYTIEEIQAVLSRGSLLNVPIESQPEESVIQANADISLETAPVSVTEPPVINESAAESAVTPMQNETDESLEALFPNLSAERSGSTETASSKDIFLTFEGAPSDNMWDILTILNRQNANAAFFIDRTGGEDGAEALRTAVSDKNTLGVLAGGGKTYSDAESYLADFAALYTEISEAADCKPVLYRIPDDAAMSEEVRNDIVSELDRRGFVYCGYNTVSNDRLPDSGWQEIFDAVSEGVFRNKVAEKASVVQLHGGKDDTVTVYTVEDIITELAAKGYSFKAFSDSTVIS